MMASMLPRPQLVVDTGMAKISSCPIGTGRSLTPPLRRQHLREEPRSAGAAASVQPQAVLVGRVGTPPENGARSLACCAATSRPPACFPAAAAPYRTAWRSGSPSPAAAPTMVAGWRSAFRRAPGSPSGCIAAPMTRSGWPTCWHWRAPAACRRSPPVSTAAKSRGDLARQEIGHENCRPGAGSRAGARPAHQTLDAAE